MHELGFFFGTPLETIFKVLADLPNNLPGWPLELIQQRFSTDHHGDYSSWIQALVELPDLDNATLSYKDTVSISGDVDTVALERALQRLHPWRKGPFQIGDLKIDTEWRSDWKWARVAPSLGDISGHRILDIGCGNGYFGWRMLAQGAAEVIGIDPTLLFCMQHLAIQKYTQDYRNWVLPLKIEEIPDTCTFDSVFSMGVIYHRREPQDHVEHLARLTKPGGQVILESLIVAGDQALVPPDRYARMRNVWCVPTMTDMRNWLAAAGLVDIQTIDVSITSTEEQRSTPWMRFESLTDTLDSTDPSKTVEGLPAPTRGVLIAHKPR